MQKNSQARSNHSPKKIAVIGAGISGLSAAYLYSQKHEVHLFENESRLGGHANTVEAGSMKTPVDMGFIVFNNLNYPHLTGFFKHLDVEVSDSEMSLSVKFAKPDLEWGGTTLLTLIAQRRNLFRPKFWVMIQDILRFHKEAHANLERSKLNKWTLRELLADGKYRQSFIDWYLVPMGAAIWSSPTDTMLEFPAETFLQFALNHRLLQVDNRPTWKTVVGGSNQYVQKVAAKLQNIHSGSPVQSVRRLSNLKVELIWKDQRFEFDQVIFATHPPQTLQILKDVSKDERKTLECFQYQKNTAVLHSDESFMPKRRSLWSAWNFHQQDDGLDTSPVSLSYWMNRLQPLKTQQQMILSLNATLTPKLVHKEEVYEHPLFNHRAIDAQTKQSKIQGSGGIFHCGARNRYGNHEDGNLSAVLLARAAGVAIPWLDQNVVETQEIESEALSA